jgi:outer membrane protein TolC
VLVAELFNRRVGIAVNQRLLALAQENATNRQTLYDLVKHRYELGTPGSTLSDVYLAEDNFTSVQAEVAEFQRLLTDEVYRFDVLLGRPPGSIHLNHASFPLLSASPDAPSLIPAALLDRRPDLRASELRVQAANANVSVAVSDLYPQFHIGGSIGVTGTSTQNLFSSE